MHFTRTLSSLVALSVCGGLAVWSTGLQAAPITYTESATVSGFLNGVAFTNDVITITGTADTTGVFNDGIFRNNLSSASFSISGDGSGKFTDAIQVVDDQTSTAAAGFEDATDHIILDTLNAAFATYDLRTAIGPITGSPLTNPGVQHATTAGALIIDTSGNSTFTATTGTIATPGTLPLFAGCLGALGLLGWRRKRKAQAVA